MTDNEEFPGSAGAVAGVGAGAGASPADAAPETRAEKPRRRARTMRATVGMILLGFQLIVTVLGVLGIMGLGALPRDVALIAGGGLLALQVAAIAALHFTGSAVLGWVVEIASVLLGFVQPAMFVAGGMFLVAWWWSMRKAAAVDRARAPIIATYEDAIARGATEDEAREIALGAR